MHKIVVSNWDRYTIELEKRERRERDKERERQLEKSYKEKGRMHLRKKKGGEMQGGEGGWRQLHK